VIPVIALDSSGVGGAVADSSSFDLTQRCVDVPHLRAISSAEWIFTHKPHVGELVLSSPDELLRFPRDTVLGVVNVQIALICMGMSLRNIEWDITVDEDGIESVTLAVACLSSQVVDRHRQALRQTTIPAIAIDLKRAQQAANRTKRARWYE